MHKIVAFTGKRGHGKTTAAQALEIQHKFAHFNFADPLRTIAKIAYSLSDAEVNDPVLKEQVLDRWPFKAPREILQQIGTEMFRAFVQDTWTMNWQNRAREALAIKRSTNGEVEVYSSAPGVTCSDLRFLNEEDAIRAAGGIIIRVVDPRKNATDAASQHASELEMESIKADYTIINDGDIQSLQAQVLAIVFGS